MAIDKNKITAEATKLVQKGSFDKAIKAYEKILAEDPKDVRVLLKVGELHQKKGEDKDAAAAFKKVAETYAEQGFFLKAVAVCKQIVKLDPDDLGVNERLAGLYQQLGLIGDAMAQLQAVATVYDRAGDTARLVDVLKRMVALDPENIASSIKLGELYARSNQPGPALDAFRRAADYLKRHNRADEWVRVADRISALQPDDVALTREVANVYLAKGDTKRALAKLQHCFKADPKDVETLNLLAQAFRDLGQTAKTVSVFKELARVHEEQGRRGDAEATWRKVSELDPEDEDAAAALGGGTHAQATPAAALAPPPPAPRPRAPPPGPPPGAARAVIAPPPPAAVAAPSGPASDAVAKLLTETDVYVKYGLHEKALEHVRKVLALDPGCAEAHEKAREVHEAAGRTAEAADAAVAAARAWVAKGDATGAQHAVARLREIDPASPALQELASAAGGAAVVELEPVDADELAIPLGSGGAFDDDALALAAAESDGDEIVEDEREPAPPAAAHDDEGVSLEIVLPDAGSDLDAAGDALAEAAALSSAESEEVVEDEPPALAPAPARPVRPSAAPAAPKPPPPAPKAPPPPGRAVPPPGRAARPAPPPAEADLSAGIEEAEFFVQQGLLDDAAEALRHLLSLHPGHREVQAHLAEVERKRTASATPATRGAPTPPASAAPSPKAPARGSAAPRPTAPPVRPDGVDESFDIARELAEELGPPGESSAADAEFQYSVEDVFNQFKKGVEATVRPEDSATHYDLGIAYKEMGLLDDAIQEFETARTGNDRRREIDCLSMIGLCRIAKGEPRPAILAFRRALASEHLTRDAAKALYYELAAAYEASGEAEVALFCLQRVNKVDPAFRDVAQRVAALGGGPGRPPQDGAARAGAAPVRTPAPGRSPAPARASDAARPAAPPKKNIGYL